MIELVLAHSQAVDDIPKTVPVGQLTERHAIELTLAGEVLNLVIPGILPDNSRKCLVWKVIHQLREDETT